MKTKDCYCLLNHWLIAFWSP